MSGARCKAEGCLNKLRATCELLLSQVSNGSVSEEYLEDLIKRSESAQAMVDGNQFYQDALNGRSDD